MLTLSTIELGRVTGGGAAWDSYVKNQRAAVAPADKIRAAETIKGVCLGGTRLDVRQACHRP